MRDYRPSDFEALWALDQACFAPGIAYARAELRRFLSLKTAETLVAEGAEGIVAFVLGARRGRREGHVITLDVAAGARRQGVGRDLLARLEERFRAQGARRIRLEVAVDNAVAITFYERHGYQPVARIADYYGPELDAWQMEKALPVE